MTELYEIGRFYKVPTVYAKFFHKVDHWPVIGPKHEDREIIGFEPEHYHLDFRFFSAQRWTWFIRQLTRWWVFSSKQDAERSAWSIPLIALPNYPLGSPVIRRRKYCRLMPDFDFDNRAPYLSDLQDLYSSYELKDDLICPHRGASLIGLMIDSEGCVRCPLHGLRWNVDTKKLQPTNRGD